MPRTTTLNAVRLALEAARVLVAKSREKMGLCHHNRYLVDTDHLSQLIREYREEKTTNYTTTISQRNTNNDQTKKKVSVVAWDTAHNALGRAYLLADVLRKDYHVEVIGANFPRCGTQIWEPLRNCSRVSIRSFPGGNFPNHFHRMDSIARQIDGDVIYVSKPKLPGLELAILAKLHRNRPIILDIDDYESSSFKHCTPLSLDAVKKRTGKLDFRCPYGETWTRYSESLIPFFDRITVSNEELQKKFGGVVIPHIRDEQDFTPSSCLRDIMRNALDFSSHDMVILFIGTPRMHKGLPRVHAALKKLNKPNYKLLVIGSPVDSKTRRFFKGLDPKQVKVIPNIPFSDLPSYLCVGDLICLLQNENNLISHFQMPAKFTDGLSMGIPILASAVPPLSNLARQHLVEVLCDTPLEVKIDVMLSNSHIYKDAAIRNRDVFLREYSYGAIRFKLKRMLDKLLYCATPMPREFRKLISYHRDIYFTAAKNTNMHRHL